MRQGSLGPSSTRTKCRGGACDAPLRRSAPSFLPVRRLEHELLSFAAMKRVVILGAGTGGTMMANKLARALPDDAWKVTLVDRDDVHIYQPGLLFLPFLSLIHI